MSEMCSDGVDVGLLQSDMCWDGVEVGVSTSPKWWMPVGTDKGPGTATSLQAAGTSRELSTEMPVGTDDGPETANGLLTAGTSRNWSTAWNTQFKTRLPQMVFCHVSNNYLQTPIHCVKSSQVFTMIHIGTESQKIHMDDKKLYQHFTT